MPPIVRSVNEAHLEFCASEAWAEMLQDYILPWALGDEELGEDVLEVGAGPGLSQTLIEVAV